jgi:hypothetical protein
MRWRSWRGADRSAETAKERIHVATREVDAVIQPTSALVMGIVSASWGYTQTLNQDERSFRLHDGEAFGLHPRVFRRLDA